jgi:hypothetical protein
MIDYILARHSSTIRPFRGRFLGWLVFPSLMLVLMSVVAACGEETPQPQVPMPIPSLIATTVVAGIEDPLAVCVNHNDLGLHVHVLLVPVVHRQPTTLPANIGITQDCLRAIHTHSDDNVLHIEYPEDRVFTLGEFFEIWGDENPYVGLEMTGLSVNGQRHMGGWEELVLEDHQRIALDFGIP